MSRHMSDCRHVSVQSWRIAVHDSVIPARVFAVLAFFLRGDLKGGSFSPLSPEIFPWHPSSDGDGLMQLPASAAQVMSECTVPGPWSPEMILESLLQYSAAAAIRMKKIYADPFLVAMTCKGNKKRNGYHSGSVSFSSRLQTELQVFCIFLHFPASSKCFVQ